VAHENENGDLSKLSDEERSALLDFHSDRAVAHASFFVASIFGLFAVLSIAENSPENRTLWTLPYWALFLIGFYSFANFSLYAVFAHKIECEIRGDVKLPQPETFFISSFHRLKTKMRQWKLNGREILTPLMISLYIIVAAVSSFLVFGAEITGTGVLVIIIGLFLAYYYSRDKKP